MTEKYTEGKIVAVSYDPDDPGNGVLERSGGCGLWLLFFGGLYLLAVSALFLYIGPEKFR